MNLDAMGLAIVDHLFWRVVTPQYIVPLSAAVKSNRGGLGQDEEFPPRMSDTTV